VIPASNKSRPGSCPGLVLVSLLAFLALSCGGEPPEVLSVESRLELRPSAAGSYESLSAFANVRDLNGMDDIEAINIVNDGAGLVWRLSDETWTRRKEGGDTWIGAADLAMADYSPLPRGEYRLEAVNLAGQKAEKTFRIDVEARDATSPGLELAPGRISLVSTWPENLVLGYDAAGGLIAAHAAANGDSSLADLFGAAVVGRVQTIVAYGYDPKRRFGAYTWRMKRK
jgi:hypothetical protein